VYDLSVSDYERERFREPVFRVFIKDSLGHLLYKESLGHLLYKDSLGRSLYKDSYLGIIQG